MVWKFFLFPSRIFLFRKIRDMFSRATPEEVEEIKKAETLFGNDTRKHNPANAQENGAVAIAVLAPRGACV